MPSCPYGAAIKPGESDWYTVTSADISTWFSGYPTLFLWWVNGWVGRQYSLSLLALENPPVPAVMPWTDLVLGLISGGRWGAAGTLSSAMDDLIAYHVFADHCVCTGVAGPNWTWDISGTYHGHSDYTTYQAKTLSCAPGTVITGYDHALSYVGRSGVDFKMDVEFHTGAGWVNYTNLSGLSTGDTSVHNNTVTAPAGTFECRMQWNFYDDQTGESITVDAHYTAASPAGSGTATPGPAGTVSTTGLPTIAAPTSTTSDQLMAQLQSMQFQLNQTAELVRAISLTNGLPLVAGTAHAGLSGDGEFACVALAGVRVQLSGVPTSVDRWIAHPDEYSGAGRVSFTNDQGWTENVEVSHLDTFIPCPVSASTKVGYHLLTGITATITEYPS